MPASSSRITLSSLTPDQLRTIVLDYLDYGCYTRTAAAFNRDCNPVKRLDADGDEILHGLRGETSAGDKMLEQIKLRQEIRVLILSGRIDEAIEALNKHFPTVLAETMHPPQPDSDDISSVVGTAGSPIDGSESKPYQSNLEYISSTSTEPGHLLLNLRILAFCEACRTVPLDYPPETAAVPSVIPFENGHGPGDVVDTYIGGPEEDEEESEEDEEQQMALLLKAQKLYAYSSTLPSPADRATYSKELENVSGLLAYRRPEKSSMSKYLSMERREAVADQINRAILKRSGRPLESALELVARYTTVLWDSARELGVKPRPGVVLPPKTVNPADMEVDNESVSSFSLPRFLGSRP